MSSFALRCWVEVSLGRIAENYRAIREVVGPDVEVTPVVKADAYHHGAVEVARTLLGEGARRFAVATAAEGAELRDSGISAPVLAMSDSLPGDREALADYRLTPVIHSLADLREWDAVAARRGLALPYHLKIDSGFGRLGMCSGVQDIIDAVRAARHTELEGIMTHFASAGDYLSTQTGDQIRSFERIARQLKEAGIQARYTHMASSVPIALGRRECWGNMVRPGISLYGYVPAANGPAPPCALQVRPALEWKASVLTVKDVPEGAPIGYGALFRANKPIRIAVISAGYADGVPHTLKCKGAVIVRGRLAPILGAVSMDVITVDVSECGELTAGHPVTLIGEEGGVSRTAEDLARETGIISYAVLCGISGRVRRVYR